MNSRDLCLMPKLDKILEAGIDLLKVEGRNKTPYYVAQTARAYRKAIDDWFEDPNKWDYRIYQEQLDTLQNRGYTYGFFDGVPGPEAQNYESTQSNSQWRNAGVIREWTDEGCVFEIYQKTYVGTELYFLMPNSLETRCVKIEKMKDGFTNNQVDYISPGKKGQTIILDKSLFNNFTLDDFPKLTVARLKI